jgi:hypothetical protein
MHYFFAKRARRAIWRSMPSRAEVEFAGVGAARQGIGPGDEPLFVEIEGGLIESLHAVPAGAGGVTFGDMQCGLCAGGSFWRN